MCRNVKIDQTAEIGKNNRIFKRLHFIVFQKMTLLAIYGSIFWVLIEHLFHRSARICSVHFKKEFDRKNPHIQLRPKALPFIEKRQEEESFVACSQPSTKADKTTMTLPSIEDKATMVSLKQIYDSLEKCRLRQRIKHLKVGHARKVRSLQQNLRRCNYQIAILKAVLNLLKEKQLLTET